MPSKMSEASLTDMQPAMSVPPEHFRRVRPLKWTNNLAAFAAAAFGLPLFLLVERPGERALSGFLTHFSQGLVSYPISAF